MISLKSLLKNIKEAKITQPKKGVETPLDAKVQIPGFGVMTRKQMQGSIQRYITEVSKYIKKGDAEQAYSALSFFTYFEISVTYLCILPCICFLVITPNPGI